MSVSDERRLPPREPLTPEQTRRYGRHLVIPEVGIEGQERLKAARVLVVGAGGLGSPVTMYLAAAGIGRLGVVEFDRVDETNLQRQILYGQADLGRDKLEAAVARLRDVNPTIEVVPHRGRFERGSALELLADYDMAVDCSDNFATRYLVNDACVLAGKPNVYGSIFRFEGQLSVFWGARGPCYRCLFPEPPPPGLVPSCSEGGVLGVLPGVIGSLQANEAIKLAAEIGEPLVGRLLLFDALKLRFRELELAKSPSCPICSENPTQTALVDYEALCAAEEPQAALAVQIAVDELARRIEGGETLDLLDVRTPLEARICSLEGSTLIPLQTLPQRFRELDPSRELVVYCHHGNRSGHAVDFLRRMGYERARNLTGGIDAWSRTVDPTVARY